MLLKIKRYYISLFLQSHIYCDTIPVVLIQLNGAQGISFKMRTFKVKKYHPFLFSQRDFNICLCTFFFMERCFSLRWMSCWCFSYFIVVSESKVNNIVVSVHQLFVLYSRSIPSTRRKLICPKNNRSFPYPTRDFL